MSVHADCTARRKLKKLLKFCRARFFRPSSAFHAWTPPFFSLHNLHRGCLFSSLFFWSFYISVGYFFFFFCFVSILLKHYVSLWKVHLSLEGAHSGYWTGRKHPGSCIKVLTDSHMSKWGFRIPLRFFLSVLLRFFVTLSLRLSAPFFSFPSVFAALWRKT